MKTTRNMLSVAIMTAALALLGAGAHADLLYSYAYTGFDTPGFTGVGNYSDNGHSGTTGFGTAVPTSFDPTGDLNDGLIRTGGSPVDGPEVVQWGGSGGGLTTQITFDFGAPYDVSEVRLGSYVFTDFANGSPTDVEISFSADGASYTPPTLFPTSFTFVTGHQESTIALASSGSQFVRLDFDASRTGGNKWGLDEVAFEGILTIPEPSTLSLLALGLVVLVRFRRLG